MNRYVLNVLVKKKKENVSFIINIEIVIRKSLYLDCIGK